MKKVISLIMSVLVVLVFASNVYADSSCEVRLRTGTEFEKDEIVVVNVIISNIMDEKGILAIEATLNYNTEVLDYIGIEPGNEWGTPFYNETNGKFVVERGDYARSEETAVRVKFKVKEYSEEDVYIALNSITVSNGKRDIKVGSARTTIRVKPEIIVPPAEETTPPIQDDPISGEDNSKPNTNVGTSTENNSNTENNKTNIGTTSNNNKPSTNSGTTSSNNKPTTNAGTTKPTTNSNNNRPNQSAGTESNNNTEQNENPEENNNEIDENLTTEDLNNEIDEEANQTIMENVTDNALANKNKEESEKAANRAILLIVGTAGIIILAEIAFAVRKTNIRKRRRAQKAYETVDNNYDDVMENNEIDIEENSEFGSNIENGQNSNYYYNHENNGAYNSYNSLDDDIILNNNNNNNSIYNNFDDIK